MSDPKSDGGTDENTGGGPGPTPDPSPRRPAGGSEDPPLPNPNRPGPLGWLRNQLARRRRRFGASLDSLPRSRRELRNWLQVTDNFLSLSVVLLVPLVIATVTAASNAYAELSFLLFPPLASGAYSLFSNPDERQRSAANFIRGTTTGSLCGYGADLLVGGNSAGIDPVVAGVAMLFVGIVTWMIRLQSPSAFATALLVLTTTEASAVAYVASVAIGSAIVAGVFVGWYEAIYKRRTKFLYGSLSAADRVAVPAASADDPAIHLGAALATAHDAGQLILVGVIDEPAVDVSDDRAAGDLAGALSVRAETMAERYELACETAVAAGDIKTVITDAVQRSGSDLVVASGTPDDATRIQTALGIETDAVALRSFGGREPWRRVIVMIARPGDIAHAMLDFASRIADAFQSAAPRGRAQVTACTCISAESERRAAERLLASLAHTTDQPVDTRIVSSDPASFVADNDGSYDLVLFGAPHRRDNPARFVTGDGADQLGDVSCDVAVVDREESWMRQRRLDSLVAPDE